jgi:hypothetical protein
MHFLSFSYLNIYTIFLDPSKQFIALSFKTQHILGKPSQTYYCCYLLAFLDVSITTIFLPNNTEGAEKTS